MSDIGFYGLAAALVGLAMLAVAVVGLAVEAAVLRRRRRRGEAGAPRTTLLGPLGYGLTALAMMYAVEEGPLGWKDALDSLALPIAGLGLLPWAGIHLHRRRHRQEGTEGVGPDRTP